VRSSRDTQPSGLARDGETCYGRFLLHSSRVNAAAVTPDGKHAVSASADRTLRVWDLASGRTTATFTADAGVSACAVAVDGITIVAGDGLGRLHFLRLIVP
jgi:WD40 repeat protein